jgi:UDPglucose 6-dehydrogenase
MEICVIGGGYVGAVAAACFAEIGRRVVLIEKDLEKLSNYRQGRSSHYEPGLDELLGKVTQEGRLQFSDLNRRGFRAVG